MAKVIEEFYYGNLDPQARSIEKNKSMQQQRVACDLPSRVIYYPYNKQRRWHDGNKRYYP